MYSLSTVDKDKRNDQAEIFPMHLALSQQAHTYLEWKEGKCGAFLSHENQL